MAFRYLNVANASWTDGKGKRERQELGDLIEQTKQYLQELPTHGEDILSREDIVKTYEIIVEKFLQNVPSIERRSAVWRLAQSLPLTYSPILEDILSGCD